MDKGTIKVYLEEVENMVGRVLNDLESAFEDEYERGYQTGHDHGYDEGYNIGHDEGTLS